jgi:hypothetical protein
MKNLLKPSLKINIKNISKKDLPQKEKTNKFNGINQFISNLNLIKITNLKMVKIILK